MLNFTRAVRSFATTVPRRAVVSEGPALTQTNRAEITLRRFWKTVNLAREDDGRYQVLLDKRNLKTPGGTRLLIPSERRILALLIANEWENQDQVLKQHALPLTSLASRAIDGMGDEATRRGVIDSLLRYLETDTILYPEEYPPPLVRMQHEHWDPLFLWVKEEYGIDLNRAEGLNAAKQTVQSVRQLREAIEGLDIYELASFERAAYATKSFVIALALCRGRLTANQAAEASHVEVRSQIERWGEVEDTHDVDYQDIRRALGSVACALIRG